MDEITLTRRKALLGAAAALVVSCTPSASGSPSPSAAGSTAAATQRASAPFKWLFGFTIQANPSFPIIVAKEKGYFAEQNLNVSWDFVTSSAQSAQLLGTAAYNAGSVSDAGTIANYVIQGLPLKAIAQQGADSAHGFAVKKGSGIKTPKDFEGRKVGIKPGNPWSEYLALLALNKVDRSKITEVPVGFSSVELKDGLVDVLPVFVGNEPYVLKNTLGLDIDLINPKDFGVSAVGTAMIANTEFIKNNRDVAVRFLKAVFHGQEYFLTHRDEMLQMAVQYGGTATSRGQHEFIYDVSQKDMQAGEMATKGVGWITKSRWQENLDQLSQVGVLKTPVKVDDVVDSSLIESILKDGKVIWP